MRRMGRGRLARPFGCFPLVFPPLIAPGISRAEEDYRAHLEKAFEVMATRTMEYRKLVGMGKGERSEMKQKPDGRTLRGRRDRGTRNGNPGRNCLPGCRILISIMPTRGLPTCMSAGRRFVASA